MIELDNVLPLAIVGHSDRGPRMIAHIFDLPEWLLIGFVAAGALGFVGGAFVFSGTFTTVTVWEVEQSQAAAIMSEFTAAIEFV